MYSVLIFYHSFIYTNALIANQENNVFDFILCNTVKDAIQIVSNQQVSMCVVEQLHPESLSFLSALKLTGRVIPTLLISEGNTPEEKLRALEIGCDEYIFKPVISIELKLRMQSLLKRSNALVSQSSEGVHYEQYPLGRSVIDFSKRTFTTGSHTELLTRKESILLRILYTHKNILVPHETILNQAWKTSNHYSSKSMVVYVNKLRKKLQADPDVVIENLHGAGYILKDHTPYSG